MAYFTEPSPTADTTRPMGMVGAGRLTSMIWKTGDEISGWHYRFNLFRTGRRGARVSQLFAPADVIHFVKLAQVLAAVIADDGCLNPVERGALTQLAADLDRLWARFPKPSKTTSCCREFCSDSTAHKKGPADGDAPGP